MPGFYSLTAALAGLLEAAICFWLPLEPLYNPYITLQNGKL